MFNRFLAFVLAVVLAAAPIASRAQLADVLDGLSTGAVANVNGPGRFQSQARTSTVLGGFEMRLAPTKNTPTLVSFTPPRFDAGCAGVSAFFGGFSFISGKEFEQLLKNISSGVALGFVGHLALKTLCPQCEAVVQLMQRLNQIASMASKDACKYGETLAKAFTDKTGLGGSSDTNAKCAQGADASSQEGLVSDMLSGLNSLCTSVTKINEALDTKVIAKMKEWADAGMSEQQREEAARLTRLEGGQGNRTWLLSEVFFKETDPQNIKPRTLIMNILGTTIYQLGAVTGTCASEKPRGEKGEIYCKETLTPKEAMELFMCGVEKYAPEGVATSVKESCKESVGFKAAELANKRIMECDNADLKNCMNVLSVPYSDSTVLNNYVGISFQVSRTLREAVKRVISDQRLWDGGNSDAEGKKIVALIQAAPYPIYQAINAAAVYPAASAEILDSLTMLISEQLALSYFNEFFRLAGRSTGPTDLSEPMVRSLSDGLKAFSDRVEALKEKTATNLAVQDGITQSIRTLNQAIQRQVMTEELFGSNQFGKGLTSLVNTGAGGTPRSSGSEGE